MPKQQSETKQLAMQGIILVIASFAVRFIGFFYRIPLTNLWGDEGNDAYSMAYQIYNLCIIISSFGVPATISRMIGKRLALKQYAEAKKVVKLAFLLIGGLGVLCAVVLWFGNRWIAGGIFGVPSAAIAIRVESFTLILVAFMSVLRGLFQGMNNMKPTAISQVIEQIVNAASSLIFAFALFGRGMEWGVAGGISGALFGGIFAIGFLVFCYYLYSKRSWVGNPKYASKYAKETDQEIIKEMLMLLVPIVLATSVMNIKSIIDSSLFLKLMKVKGYLAEEASAMRGIYQGKFVLLTTLPIAIGNALGTASVPSIARSITLKEKDQVKAKITMQVKLILLISIPAAVGMAAVADPLLHLLYPGAPDGANLFWVGSFQVVFYSVTHVATGILQGIGKVRLPVKNAIASGIIAWVFLLLFILALNMNVYSLVVNDLVFSGMLAFLDLSAVLQYGRVKLNWKELLIKPLIAAGVMGICCIGTFTAIQHILHSNALGLIGSIGAAILMYFLVLMNIGGISNEDMQNIPMGRYLRYFKIRK